MKTYADKIARLEERVRALELQLKPRPLTADEEGRFANPRTGIRPMHRFPVCGSCNGLRKIGLAHPGRELVDWTPCPACSPESIGGKQKSC